MSATERDVDRGPGRDGNVGAVERHDPVAPDDEPVLRPALVTLVAQPLTREHLDAFHLVVGRVLQDGVAAPRALVVLALRSFTGGAAPPGPPAVRMIFAH